MQAAVRNYQGGQSLSLSLFFFKLHARESLPSPWGPAHARSYRNQRRRVEEGLPQEWVRNAPEWIAIVPLLLACRIVDGRLSMAICRLTVSLLVSISLFLHHRARTAGLTKGAYSHELPTMQGSDERQNATQRTKTKAMPVGERDTSVCCFPWLSVSDSSQPSVSRSQRRSDYSTVPFCLCLFSSAFISNDVLLFPYKCINYRMPRSVLQTD